MGLQVSETTGPSGHSGLSPQHHLQPPANVKYVVTFELSLVTLNVDTSSDGASGSSREPDLSLNPKKNGKQPTQHLTLTRKQIQDKAYQEKTRDIAKAVSITTAARSTTSSY